MPAWYLYPSMPAGTLSCVNAAASFGLRASACVYLLQASLSCTSSLGCRHMHPWMTCLKLASSIAARLGVLWRQPEGQKSMWRPTASGDDSHNDNAWYTTNCTHTIYAHAQRHTHNCFMSVLSFRCCNHVDTYCSGEHKVCPERRVLSQYC